MEKSEFYKGCTTDELFRLAESFVKDTRLQLGLCATNVKDMQYELDLFEYRTRPIIDSYTVGRN